MTTIHRLDDDEVIEMARGIVLGDRYPYPNIGMVVGDMRSTSHWADNGDPQTFSGWFVHEDDIQKVRDKITEYHRALGVIDGGWDKEEE